LGSQAINVNYDHWIAFALLVAAGAHMCWEGYQHNSDELTEPDDPKAHSAVKILFISTITSIDNLAVGVSLGVAAKPLFDYSIAIGLAAFAATYLGLSLAKIMPSVFGSRLEIIGGAILVAIGIKTILL
jgi:putative Mn2+ efflux pump MntP